jgi:hypothetical protein
MKKFWMIYRDGANAPTHKHESKEAAMQEAERLYHNSGGNNIFYVLEAIGSLKPIANFEWSETD